MKNLPLGIRNRCIFFTYLTLCIPLFTILLSVAPQIQNITINGRITDTTGMPLAGVHVMSNYTKKGVATDFDGAYEIEVNPNDSLLITAIGYKSQTRAVNNQKIINIALVEDITELGTVMVNAGYYSVSEREQTGNISKITTKEIEQSIQTNPLSAIQGRIAGVEIIQSSGLTGSGIDIKIRGQNSIRPNGNEPLYIVDGIQYSSSSMGDRQTSGAIVPDSGFSPLNNINASDIESIEILKDADATAIYGSRGANGVVLITTKKGKNESVKLNLELSSGQGHVANEINLLRTQDYLLMRNEAYTNDGITNLPFNAYDVNGTWGSKGDTNWQKELFGKTAYLTKVQANISGGNSTSNFLLSGNYNKQTSVFQGNFKNNIASFLGNFNHKSKNEKLSISFSANYTRFNNNLPPTSLVREALLLPPNAPKLYNDDGELNWENSTWNNPLRNSIGKYQANSTTLIGNTSISYNITKYLKLKTSFGYTESKLKEIKTNPHIKFNPAYGLDSQYSSAIHNNGNRASWIIEPQLDWQIIFKKTKIKTLIGSTFQEENADKTSIYASGFTNNSLIENIIAANNITIFDDSDSKYRYHAIFGRLNLSHKDKYLLNLTGRRDGSSRFGSNKKFANFYAIGAAWIFTKESFMQEFNSFINYGKIRASIGTSGNDQIGDYQYLDTYSIGNSQYQNIIGLSPTRLYNPDFSWEKNQKKEIAIELALFNNSFNLACSFYKNNSSNQLIGIPLPAITGFSTLNANLDATINNSGWEFELESLNLNRNKLKWRTNFNLTFSKNKLIEFPDLEGSTYANTLTINKPLNIIKLYNSKGVNPSTGLFEFTDFNEDGIISSPYDKQIIKDLNPKFFGGINNSFSYGRFNLDFLFQFTKQEGINYLATGSVVGTMNNQPQEVLNRWQFPGDNSSIQRFTSGLNSEASRAYTNYAQSDASINDASFIRLKTLSLSYTLSSLDHQPFGCSIYLLGQNLLTLTNYNGLDPENRSSRTIPPLRYFTIGTKLTF